MKKSATVYFAIVLIICFILIISAEASPINESALKSVSNGTKTLSVSPGHSERAENDKELSKKDKVEDKNADRINKSDDDKSIKKKEKKIFFKEEKKEEKTRREEKSQKKGKKDEKSSTNVDKKEAVQKEKKEDSEEKLIDSPDGEEKQIEPDKKMPIFPDRKKFPKRDGEPVKITAIEIIGNTHIPTEEILGAIRSKVGGPLLEPRIRSDVQSIYEMGYFTDVKLDTPYYAGGVKIVFRIQENPIVKKITILGNKIVKTSKIRELMQTKEGKILNMKTLNADMSEINYYYDEVLGYLLKPTHIKNINWTSDGELILTIQEGMIIKKVEVSGSTLFSEEKMLSFVKTKPGELFNTKKIKEDTTEISKFYEDEGYILDTIRPQVNYKEKIVTIQIIEAVVESIKLKFQNKKHKTKDYVVLRNIRTKPGEVLKRKKLQRDIERLNSLGYFSKVTVDPEPGSKPGNLVLVFKLKEQKTGLATLGVGYTGGGSGALRSGITGAVSYSEKNLGGTGQAASVGWQRGVNIDALSTSYFNPAINKNQDSIGISVFRHKYMELRQPLSNDPDNNKYALYDDKRYGGRISYGRRVTDDFRLFLSFNHETIEISRNSKSDYKPMGISKGCLNAAGLGALYDTRNDVFDPTDGTYVSGDFTYAGRALKGRYKFNKYQLETRKYFPLGRKRKSTIALRAWGGLVRGGTIPITETFYVGGADTIRGYVENEFFGTRMVVLNAEYRFPLFNIKFLKGAIFADAGNAWFSGDKRKKLYTDKGAGIRIVFPTLGLGVIRLDYASCERGGRTSIGIGQTF